MIAGTSNERAFNPLKRPDININLASGLSANTKTKIADGIAGSKVIYNLLFRNFDGSNARNFNIWVGTDNTSTKNNIVQVAIPANAGNNGSVGLASLYALSPQFFSITDLAGNYFKMLDDATYSIWVENIVTLTATVNITCINGDMA